MSLAGDFDVVQTHSSSGHPFSAAETRPAQVLVGIFVCCPMALARHAPWTRRSWSQNEGIEIDCSVSSWFPCSVMFHRLPTTDSAIRSAKEGNEVNGLLVTYLHHTGFTGFAAGRASNCLEKNGLFVTLSSLSLQIFW